MIIAGGLGGVRGEVLSNVLGAGHGNALGAMRKQTRVAFETHRNLAVLTDLVLSVSALARSHVFRVPEHADGCLVCCQKSELPLPLRRTLCQLRGMREWVALALRTVCISCHEFCQAAVQTEHFRKGQEGIKGNPTIVLPGSSWLFLGSVLGLPEIISFKGP